MKSSRKKLIWFVILLLFLLPTGVAFKMVSGEVRQASLNHALLAAVKQSNTAEVMDLLKDGADPNAKDIPPDTRSPWRRLWDRFRGKPLQTGHAHTALLVALEVNINKPSSPFPPENVPLIKALLDAGATVNIADENGNTPLIWAAMAYKTETVRLLLDRKADVNAKSKDGSTALYCAVPDGDLALVKLLITRGALVNARGIRNTIPLHNAAFNGNVTIARILLDSGGDIHARDDDGETPLSSASLGDHVETVKLLLERGAKVNTKDNKGRTAMIWAQRQGDAQMVQILKAAALQQARGKR